MVKEGNIEEASIVLTKPLSIAGDTNGDYEVPKLAQRIFSLFKNLRPGSDLTHFQIPAIFNIPKSQLQCYGESVYCVGKDMLGKCNNGKDALERFKSVVAWSISTTRPAVFGVSPYNPILGETHHVSNGTLNVLLEQVSHHPPVSALHATDEHQNIEMLWCQRPVPRFYGTSVEVEVRGRRELKLKKHGETYVMNSPKLFIKFLPPRVDWVGKVQINCQETGLEAELWYLSKSSFFGKPHFLKGKIYHSSSLNTLFDITGHWNSTVVMKDVKNGKESILYNAKEVISELKPPIVKDLQGVWASESARVWREVSKSILCKNWDKAKAAKKAIEEEQRELQMRNNINSNNWIPKHFIVSHSIEGGWSILPIRKCVPLAPIILPN